MLNKKKYRIYPSYGGIFDNFVCLSPHCWLKWDLFFVVIPLNVVVVDGNIKCKQNWNVTAINRSHGIELLQ